MTFGVQTFTVRRAQKKSIEKAYLPLIKLGIKSFEVARIDFSPQNAERITALIKEYGIEISSIQVKPKYVFGDMERIIEFCKATGCKNVVISMLPFKCILGGEKRFYDFISLLDEQFEKYEKRGITLAYHHHNWEYVKLSNGKTRMNELINGTRRIKFVHDTYWSARSGIAPERQMREFGDRLLGIHLRDLEFGRRGLKVLPRDCAVGDGVIDFSAVLSAVRKSGCEYLVIEQNTKTPYTEIEKSLKKLSDIKLGVRL